MDLVRRTQEVVAMIQVKTARVTGEKGWREET